MSEILTAVEQCLLGSGGLDFRFIEQSLSSLNEAGADFCDIFFEQEISESFALEESKVKSGSFDITKGVGVRLVAGEKSGFAYSDVIEKDAILRAVEAVKGISRGHSQTQRIHIGSDRQIPALYVSADPIGSVPRHAKVRLLEDLDRRARALDPRVRQVMAGLSCRHRHMLVVGTDGTLGYDIKPMVSIYMNVIMEQQGRLESGFASAGGAVLLSSFDLDRMAADLTSEAVRTASINLEALPAPAGVMPVVLGAGWPGVLIHEAVGHGLEGDFNRTGSSAFTGRVGQQVASSCCTVIDDGSIPDRRGSVTYDDEGTPGQQNVLIENGILKGYMQDKQNAMLMGVRPHGNGRRKCYDCLPLPRMTNTYLKAGKYERDEIISSVKKGIYAENFSGGQVDISSGRFVFSASLAYLIEDGRITAPVKGMTLIGNGPEVMRQISMVGNDLEFDRGIGSCGKAGQSVAVGIGQPTVKLDQITVGGTEA